MHTISAISVDTSYAQRHLFTQQVVILSQNKLIVFSGVIVTGSWDKTVKVWDPRQRQSTGTYSQPDKVRASL